MQRTVDICSYLSSHSTSASVSELSRLVTHTAVSSSKCNSENRPLCYNVAFRTLFKWHRYCGILKIHIVRKINTGIRYEPVYRPALDASDTCVVYQRFSTGSLFFYSFFFSPLFFSPLGEHLWVRCLAQGFHLSRGQFLPEPRFEPTTSGYKSNALSIRPRLPPLLIDIITVNNSFRLHDSFFIFWPHNV